LPKSKNDLSFRELLLHPELLSECLILSKKLHPEWTKIRGSGQDRGRCVWAGTCLPAFQKPHAIALRPMLQNSLNRLGKKKGGGPLRDIRPWRSKEF